jgi:pilus assembly protein CpaC
MISRARIFRSALAAFIIVILVAAPQAQQATTQFVGASGPAPIATPREPGDTTTDIDLLVGRSLVVNVGSVISRVSLTVPDIADALVTAPSQLLVHGKQPGTISLFIWDRNGSIKTFEVKVRRDLTALAAQLRQLFPGEAIVAVGSGKDVVLSGTVSGQYVIDRAGSVAGGYVEKKENVVNLLKQVEGVASNQVMLRVRFAEVSRSAMMELGASFFTGAGGFHDYVARSTTQQFSAPSLDMTRDSLQGPEKFGGGRDTVTATGGKATFGDFLNLFIFNNKFNVGTVIKALQDKGLFQSLAEPNLIATNGKEASFLAGGEFPYPVVQGGAGGNAVTIMFKEFGIRLSFTPTVLGGDLINLKVKPEVSALDFANGVTVEGFRVPGLTTRRTDTEVELRDGQTFAIAGLLNNTVSDTMRKIPGIGDIPILGWLFKSKAIQKNQTELVVMITPYIIKRGQMGVSESLPSPVVPFMGAPDKTLPNPDPYVGSPRYPSNQPAPRSGGTAEQAGPAAQLQGDAVASRPIQSTAPLTAAPESSVARPAPVSKAQLKALEQAREEVRKAEAAAEAVRVEAEQRDAAQRAVEARAEEKRRVEQARLDAVQATKDLAAKKQSEKLEKERAVRDAEVAKKDAEVARRKADEDAKREKTLTDAATRLKQAQAEYQAELEKTKEGANGKTKSSGKSSSPRR